MQLTHRQNSVFRASSLLALGGLVVPLGLAGCGSPAPQQSAAPISNSRPIGNQPRANTGMSTGTKLKILAGAAAAYYLYNRYKKNQEAKAANQNIQYYLSKNGRVYYRNPQNPQQVIWVTPPPQQIQQVRIPESEASQYAGFEGYEGAQSGRTLQDVFPVR